MRRSVVSIHVAPATRMEMRGVQQCEVVAGKGILGDRYEGTRHRHVSVQAQADLEAAAQDLGRPVPDSLTRRNLTVSGADLPTKPGSRFRVGEVDLEVVRIAAPCKVLDFEIGDGAKTALRRRAGVICRALTGGQIAIGDEFHQISETDH